MKNANISQSQFAPSQANNQANSQMNSQMNNLANRQASRASHTQRYPTRNQSVLNMQKIVQYFTDSQDIAIENYIFKRIAILFTLFVLAVLFLFITIEQEKPASQKFSFTSFFQKNSQEQITRVQATVDVPAPEIVQPPIEEPKPTEKLLPQGDAMGSGKILKPSITYTSSETIITIPYEGSITDYQVSNFDKNSLHSRIISLPGTWEKSNYTLRDANNPLVRLVQTANHKKEYRISISAVDGIARLQEKIYYTDTELKIVITADNT